MGSSIKLKSIVPAALLASGMITGAATAADLLVDPPVVEHEVVTKPAGGWYLRGDVSYTKHNKELGHFQVNNSNGYKQYTTSDMDESYGLRLGVGYQVNEYLRFDGTYEYSSEADFQGGVDTKQDLTNPLAIVPCFLGIDAQSNTSCSSKDTSSVSRHTIMANGYVDLGNFSGITPYVGAGLGGSYVSWDDLSRTQSCTHTGGGPDDPADLLGCERSDGVDFNGTTKAPGIDGWRFAWALHAGASYDISHNMKLDLGYSYNRIEGGPMFGYNSADLAASKLKNGPKGFDEAWDNHTFRAGIRYQIW